MLYLASEMASSTKSIDAALKACIDLVCKSLAWPVGHAYVPAQDDADELTSSGIWYLHDESAMAPFVGVTQGMRFARGRGLPGRILTSGEAAWIEDVQNDRNFSRTKLCCDLGIRSAFGFPVTVRGKVVAVLEFFTYETVKPNPHLLQTMTVLGRHIGRIFERREAEEALQESNAMMIDSLEREKRVAAKLEQAIDNLETARNVAEAATRSKSEFLANMSHEIRTPMTAILGFAECLLEPDQAPSDRLSAIHTIHRNGKHLLQIINDILDISKIEAGKVEIEQVRFSPVEIVANVQSLMRVRAEAKNLLFSIEYIGALPETIVSDPTRLKQILVNLIGNAIKFTETGGVRLITRLIEDEAEPKLQFDVLDTGIGMTRAQASRMFQAFTQADTTTTREFGGTGLGLVISKRLAEMLGGDIILESTPGEGSMFRVTVAAGSLDGVKMIDDPTSATIAQPEVLLAAKAETAKLDCRILLAEDGPDNQRLIAHVLKKAGAEVTVKENGQLAVDAALAAYDEGNPFDVILMDMQMPVLDGYDATRLLRRRGYAGPIIALTAHAMASDRDKCLKAGCDGYATKPIDRNKLIATINEHLTRGDSMTTTPRERRDALPSESAGDPDMSKPVEAFIEELPDKMAAMEKALATHRNAELATLANQIKGAAGGYGFSAISELAEHVESAANGRDDIDELKRCVEALSALCGRVEVSSATS